MDIKLWLVWLLNYVDCLHSCNRRVPLGVLVLFWFLQYLTVSDEVFACIIIGLLHYDHVCATTVNYLRKLLIPFSLPQIAAGPVFFVLNHNTAWSKSCWELLFYFHVTKEYLLVIEKSYQKHPESEILIAWIDNPSC